MIHRIFTNSYLELMCNRHGFLNSAAAELPGYVQFKDLAIFYCGQSRNGVYADVDQQFVP